MRSDALTIYDDAAPTRQASIIGRCTKLSAGAASSVSGQSAQRSLMGGGDAEPCRLTTIKAPAGFERSCAVIVITASDTSTHDPGLLRRASEYLEQHLVC